MAVKMRVTVTFTLSVSEVSHLFDPVVCIWSADFYMTTVYFIKSGLLINCGWKDKVLLILMIVYSEHAFACDLCIYLFIVIYF